MSDPKYGSVTIMSENAADDQNADKTSELTPLEQMSDEEFSALARSVCVVIPHASNEGIHPGLATHFGMWGRIGMPLVFVKDPQGGFIEVVRGNICSTFMEVCEKNPQIRYLVMIDNDEAIDWDAPLRLARHGLPIVSGIVCGYNDERGIFACIMAEDENGVCRFPSHKETSVLPGQGIRKISKCGTGLICIRKDVLETMYDAGEEPFFIPEDARRRSVRSGAMVKTEDVAFCDRAVTFGFDIYADFTVRAIHYKTLPLHWPPGCIDHTLNPDDWAPSAFDYRGAG